MNDIFSLFLNFEEDYVSIYSYTSFTQSETVPKMLTTQSSLEVYICSIQRQTFSGGILHQNKPAWIFPNARDTAMIYPKKMTVLFTNKSWQMAKQP